MMRLCYGYAVLLLLGLGAGCSDQGRDTWYEDSRKGVQNRDVYIQSQVEQGIDPKEARSLYDLKVFTLQTEGRDAGKAFEQ